MKVKIKLGASISQDFSFSKWPYCKPPEGGFECLNPDMLFDAEWLNEGWKCKAGGYGNKTPHYGNGSIYVFDKDGVEIVATPLTTE